MIQLLPAVLVSVVDEAPAPHQSLLERAVRMRLPPASGVRLPTVALLTIIDRVRAIEAAESRRQREETHVHV